MVLQKDKTYVVRTPGGTKVMTMTPRNNRDILTLKKIQKLDVVVYAKRVRR